MPPVPFLILPLISLGKRAHTIQVLLPPGSLGAVVGGDHQILIIPLHCARCGSSLTTESLFDLQRDPIMITSILNQCSINNGHDVVLWVYIFKGCPVHISLRPSSNEKRSLKWMNDITRMVYTKAMRLQRVRALCYDDFGVEYFE